MKSDVKVRVWLLEYKLMLEKQAENTRIPLIAKKNKKKAKEVGEFLYNDE